jgi:hypothetical protein
MYNLSLIQDPGISRDQLREQIKQQVQQATAEARQATREAQQATRDAGAIGQPPRPGVPVGPVGVPMISVRGGPMEMDIPPRVKDVSIAFFVMLAAVIIGLPLMRAIARRIERGTPRVAMPPETQAQIQHLMQSVDAISIEVERISEGQRFATKMLAERKPNGD